RAPPTAAKSIAVAKVGEGPTPGARTMTRTLSVLAVAALALTAAQASAQEKYTLKFREAAEGDSYTVTKVSAEKSVTKIVDDKGTNNPDADSENDFLTDKAIAVNETWVIPSDKFKKNLKPEEAKMFDLDKLKATGKLLKAYKKNGAQFAVLEITIEMPLREKS